MEISLVLATKNRTQELRKFFSHLATQSSQDFEVIVVDQNEDDRLLPIIQQYAGQLAIMHLQSAPGLSRARNVGLKYARGSIIGFPDDDCWYAPGFLTQVITFFHAHPDWDGLTGRPIASDGDPVSGRYSRRPGPIAKLDVWVKATSITLFIRRRVAEEVGGFDESLGVGAGTPWGAAEDIDFPLKALRKGFKLYYDPSMTVFHPKAGATSSSPSWARGYAYGSGFGRVLRLHRFPLWAVAYHLGRPLAGTVVSVLLGRSYRARYHWAVFQGRLVGWRARA
ncbi:MAG: glycosyltransferase family 2 protein [Symbiobacteriia bacterium]